MGRQQATRATKHALHRPTVGVPRPHLDTRPVHLAAPDHEDTLRPAGDGVTAPLLQPHRLSQYWVRPSLYILFTIYITLYYIHISHINFQTSL